MVRARLPTTGGVRVLILSISLLLMGYFVFRRSLTIILPQDLSAVTVKKYPLVLWSSDFHISPVADIKHILTAVGASVIDKSLSGHCHLSNTCEKDLRIITKNNGIRLDPCPNELISSFYDTYSNDVEMKTVDAFLCTHATSMCELFMPFNKSLIAVASTRFEIGRHSSERWATWVRNLESIARNPANVVAANNKYDQEYIRYFTSIQDVQLLPNLCGYVTDRYDPTRREVLIAPARGVNGMIAEQLASALAAFQQTSSPAIGNNYTNNLRPGRPHLLLQKSLLKISHIRDLYPHFEYGDLSKHPAIVILPYQVSFMSLFEFYRMEIPLFAPSPQLLTDWHVAYRVLNERTWASVFGSPSHKSLLSKHPRSTSSMTTDPNNEFSREAILEWISLADFYQWPHITTFDSFEHLMQLLVSVNLLEVSAQMRAFNSREAARIKEAWYDILERVQRRAEAGKGATSIESSWTPEYTARDRVNSALMQNYGIKLADGCEGIASPVG